jgi:hypothetical protein
LTLKDWGDAMATVGMILRQLFPDGTRRDSADSWDKMPFWPPDVFAFVAKLVELSGAYHHVVPHSRATNKDPFGLGTSSWRNQHRLIGESVAWGRHFTTDISATIKLHIEVGLGPDQASKILNQDISMLDELWQTISKAENCKINNGLDVAANGAFQPEPWVAAAVKLLIIMDEGCTGIGFFPREIKRNNDDTIVMNWIGSKLFAYIKAKAESQKKIDDFLGLIIREEDSGFARSFTSDFLRVAAVDEVSGNNKKLKESEIIDVCSVFDSAHCAVLPKTRTSTVGCTLRSMTHNLALLPSSSEIEARWRFPSEKPLRPKEYGLNLLLVPFPYRVNAKDFKAVAAADAAGADAKEWGFYDIEQNWLKPHSEGSHGTKPEIAFAEVVCSMVKRAKNDLGEINGIVFPEFSLNPVFFQAVCDKLYQEFITDENTPKFKSSGKTATGFEFVVAGLSGEAELYDKPDDQQKLGNFVSLLGVQRLAETEKYHDETISRKAWSMRGSREKHHRWKLNRRQIERYGLSSQLDTKKSQWENIPLSKRIVEFFQLRSGTSTTILICEDLARADPVQSVLRSVGPNLVIAILMDGPQRSFRWSGHYAGSLADDPGSSVLTLTSFGLIERGSALDNSHSRSIGYFRGSYGKDEQELQLPVGAHALAIRLVADSRTEHTLDQRDDGDFAYVWRLADVCPVSAHFSAENAWIAGGGN